MIEERLLNALSNDKGLFSTFSLFQMESLYKSKTKDNVVFSVTEKILNNGEISSLMILVLRLS